MRRYIMQVKEIMTTNVEYINPDIALIDAAKRMKNLDIGVLPVGENDRLVGMLTDRDIAVRAVAEGRDPNNTKVRNAMTSDLVYCYEDQDISEAGKMMKDNQIRRLVVLNRDKRLVGICSLGDLAVESGDQNLIGDVLQNVSQPTK